MYLCQPIVRKDCEFYIIWPLHISSQAQYFSNTWCTLSYYCPRHCPCIQSSCVFQPGQALVDLDPVSFLPTQTTAFWRCWSRGKESERPRLLWRSGDSERNSPRKPRRHSEHTDTLFLQKYTICFNDQYQKTKAKSLIETSDWNTEVGTTRVWTRCRAWIYQKKQTNTITDHEHVDTCTYNSRASVCFLMLRLISASGDTRMYCGRLSHM